jgi:hypothetical protein
MVQAIEYLDRPALGWFALAVMRKEARKWNWVALMIDVHPDDFPALYRTARQCWVRIPGKHRNEDAAWDALQELMATRH